MKFLITHINYAGMNAREMIYKSLSWRSVEALHNGPSCSAKTRASEWTWRREETQVWLKTLKLCFRGLLTFTHDGIFICRAGGGVWGESGQTLLLPAAASVQQPSITSRFPCLHTRQHNRPQSFAVLLHFFWPTAFTLWNLLLKSIPT